LATTLAPVPLRPLTVVTAIGSATALALVTVVLVLLGNSSQESAGEPVPTQEDSLTAQIAPFTAKLHAGQPYRAPKATEREAGEQGFSALLDGKPSPELAELGFSVQDGVDEKTGRPYTLVMNEPDSERAWGLYLIDRSAPVSLVVEVPHPASDLRTELFGLEYFRQAPGAVMLMAGAHRRAGENRGDVAHEEDSMFHVFAASLARRGLPQVQLHGFDDQSMPGKDFVLSPGATVAGEPAKRAADNLTTAGFVVCRVWTEPCKELEGTTNVQGKAAVAEGTMFLHVEMSRTVRNDDQRRAVVIKALAEAHLDKP
jgi:hypothetical protein